MIKVTLGPSRAIHDGIEVAQTLGGPQYVPACDAMTDNVWHRLGDDVPTTCRRCLALREGTLAVGDNVNIVRNTYWAGHYGTVCRIEEIMTGKGLIRRYHVDGGSISPRGGMAPVFNRAELAKRK